MENTLANAEKEIGLPDNEQPLYIDVDDGLIKCKWCGKNFSGSQQMRCINQHVRKSATHRQARKKFLPSNGSNRMEDQNVSGINGQNNAYSNACTCRTHIEFITTNHTQSNFNNCMYFPFSSCTKYMHYAYTQSIKFSLYSYHTDGGDQTEHDYIQMYMHPKPSGFTFNNQLYYITHWCHLVITRL